MNGLKATMILCLTLLIILATFLIYNSQQERFIMMPIQNDRSVYIFDRKTHTLNYCPHDEHCRHIELATAEESTTETHDTHATEHQATEHPTATDNKTHSAAPPNAHQAVSSVPDQPIVPLPSPNQPPKIPTTDIPVAKQ